MGLVDKIKIPEANCRSWVKVYNLAKTVTDCFKFRNKIGIDIAREALKVAVTEKSYTLFASEQNKRS